MLLLGAVTLAEAGEVLHQTADILLFLLGMMVLTWLAERAGVFEWLAESMARLARLRPVALRAGVPAGGGCHRVALARCHRADPDANHLRALAVTPPGCHSFRLRLHVRRRYRLR